MYKFLENVRIKYLYIRAILPLNGLKKESIKVKSDIFTLYE